MVHDAISLRLRGAGGEPVDLWRTINSHGFSDLPPLVVDQDHRSLSVTLRVPRGAPRRVRIRAGARGYAHVEVLGTGRLGARTRQALAAGAAYVLRLDQDLSGFYAAAADDPDLGWVASGAGRMLRSPTVWEDVVKTLCTTNCSWSLTMTMVRALVRSLGEPAAGLPSDPETNAFPSPEAMAAQDERFYREVVRSGYRAPSLLRLAEMVASGEVDLEALTVGREEVPDDEVERRLLALPGIGPYAAAHVMMTLGRNSRLILDSWTRPKYARLTGRRTVSDRTIERRFRRYGPEAGLAFWLFLTRDWVD
jgi:N-glycosylase/DNA lyase